MVRLPRVGPELKLGSAWLPSHHCLPCQRLLKVPTGLGLENTPTFPTFRKGRDMDCLLRKTLYTWMEEKGTGDSWVPIPTTVLEPVG